MLGILRQHRQPVGNLSDRQQSGTVLRTFVRQTPKGRAVLLVTARNIESHTPGVALLSVGHFNIATCRATNTVHLARLLDICLGIHCFCTASQSH